MYFCCIVHSAGRITKTVENVYGKSDHLMDGVINVLAYLSRIICSAIY